MDYKKKVQDSSDLHVYDGYIASIARETDDDGGEYLLVDQELFYDMLMPDIIENYIDLNLFYKKYSHLSEATVSEFLRDDVEEILLEKYFEITGKEVSGVLVDGEYLVFE